MNKVSLNSKKPLLTTIILMKGILVCVAVHTFHQYNKKASHYCLPVHHLVFTEKKPTYVEAKLWNDLPEELKNTELQQFGRQLKVWLQGHLFTPSEHFLIKKYNLCFNKNTHIDLCIYILLNCYQ